MASLRALKLSPRSPRRRSRVLLLMLSFEAIVSIWTAPRAKPSTISERTSWTMSCFFGAGPRIFRQAISRTLSSLWFAPTIGICIVSASKTTASQSARKRTGAAQIGLVVDPGIGPGVHELRHGQERSARRVMSRQARTMRAAKYSEFCRSPRRAGSRSRNRSFTCGPPCSTSISSPSPINEKYLWRLRHRIEKRRRIQHHEAQDAAVADVLGGAEAKAESRLAEQRGGALHQRDDGGVADPRIGIAQVGPADTRLLQQSRRTENSAA